MEDSTLLICMNKPRMEGNISVTRTPEDNSPISPREERRGEEVVQIDSSFLGCMNKAGMEDCTLPCTPDNISVRRTPDHISHISASEEAEEENTRDNISVGRSPYHISHISASEEAEEAEKRSSEEAASEKKEVSEEDWARRRPIQRT